MGAIMPNSRTWLPLLGAIALVLGGTVLPARGDKVPGFGPPGEAYYFSTDMTPITVHFVRNRDAFTPETARRQPVIATARIPRAYVIFASPYRQPDYPVLPDEIWVTQLDIVLVDPEGEPYSLIWTRLRDEGLSYSDATGHLRPLRSHVRLNASTMEYATTLTPHEAAAGQVESSIDGVSEFRHSDSGPVFFRFPENGSIRIIECAMNVERSHPSFFCSYQIRLSADVIASAHFIDFRLHGGRDFANERIANIREALCGFVTCDPRWAATRTSRGGSR